MAAWSFGKTQNMTAEMLAATTNLNCLVVVVATWWFASNVGTVTPQTDELKKWQTWKINVDSCGCFLHCWRLFLWRLLQSSCSQWMGVRLRYRSLEKTWALLSWTRPSVLMWCWRWVNLTSTNYRVKPYTSDQKLPSRFYKFTWAHISSTLYLPSRTVFLYRQYLTWLLINTL